MGAGGYNPYSSTSQNQEDEMIRIYNDLEALSQAAAELFAVQSRKASLICGRFSVALSGGETPRRLYEILASPPYRERIHWDEVHIFWSDERCVSEEDPRSNARMARQTLLDHVPIPADHIHPIHCDQSPQQAAIVYENELKDYFSTQNPNFHLVLLGLGENGHIASLFPHTPVLNERVKWVSEVYVKELSMHRITFTAPFINQASQVVFLVSGADKAQVLENVLEGAYQPHELPAQLIRPNEEHPIWLVDKAASRKLTAQTDEDIEAG
jgi:6-phosphogluconolactonase